MCALRLEPRALFPTGRASPLQRKMLPACHRWSDSLQESKIRCLQGPSANSPHRNNLGQVLDSWVWLNLNLSVTVVHWLVLKTKYAE